MSGTITLKCWVIGTPTRRIFPIDIEPDKQWNHVKDMIKEKKKPEFDDIAADTLDLWKVNIGDLESEDDLKSVMATEPLNPIKRLRTEFNDPPPDGYVNIIIVQRPTQGDRRDQVGDSSNDSSLKRSQFAPPDKIDKVIDEFLTKCRPRFQELVNSVDDIPSFLPSWEPDPSADEAFKRHTSKLCIPAIGENRPSLLLHRLGEEKTKLEHERNLRIPGVFRGQEHTVLLNTSGSGKTRLLLDGLCHNWGFYFAADTKEVGSEDFRMITKEFQNYRDFERAKGMNETKLKTPESIRHVQATASRSLNQLLLSRFLLLELLVEEIKRNGRKVSSLQNRRLWVLLQSQPTQIFGDDLFLELSRLLRPADQLDLERRIRNTCQALSSRINPSNRRSFYCVLDEAQITADPQSKDFFSEDGSSRHPLLREVWLSWTTVLSIHEMKFIIAGTGINFEEITRTLSSNVLKQQNYEVKRDIGAFDDPEDQAAYIRLYIPADWTDMKWKEFLKRSWAWFRGRHRNTASLVSLILQVGYNSPHRTINSYVKSFTAFQPTDADDWTNLESEHPPLPVLGTLNFNRMNPMQATTLAAVLIDQMLYGTYSLMGFSAEERETFVEYGFARTKAGPSSSQTVLDEPIAILAAINWVNQNAQLSFSECLRRDIGKHSNLGNGFENYLAFYVQIFFETPKNLDALFEFRSDFDEINWKSEKFELVTVSHAADSEEPHVSIVTPASGSSSNLGLRAETGEDVIAWISTNQDQFTFCFPPKHFGSDLMFYIRSTVSKKLLLVMAQAKNHSQVKLQDLIEGVRTVTPDWLWKSKAIKFKTVAESGFPQGAPKNASELAPRTHSALGEIPCGLTVTGAKYPILRVFASWPGDAKLHRSKKPSQNADEDRRYDVDLHPLATLHLDNFNHMSKSMDLKWFLGDVEQKEVIHAKRLAGSMGLDIMPKLKRAKK